MDGRGGCCIARYSNGGVYGYDMSKVNRIMLRFRPIAPKPVAGGGGTGSGEISSSSGGGAVVEKVAKVGGGRGKRRLQSNNNNNNNNIPASRRCNKRRKDCSRSPDGDLDRSPEIDRSDQTAAAVTLLPLLPESPEPKVCSPGMKRSLTWLTFDQEKNNNSNNSLSDRAVGGGGLVVPRPKPVVSSVTVECVTDTWTDGNGLGRTDEERRANLERDTCPGFMSDGFGRVTWTNTAYAKMVGGGCGGGDVMVWLVMKERLPVMAMLAYPAFTCRVRLQSHAEGVDASVAKSSVKTMPCDVWRMDGGGYAWRLDVKAALCLGR